MRSTTRTPFWAALAVALCLPATVAAQVEISARAATITVGGRLQVQFAESSVDNAPSQFFHRRARIQADVAVGEYLDGRVEPDFAGGAVALQDGWVRFTAAPAFALSAGQFKRAFTAFELHSSTDWPMIERDGRVPGQDCTGVGGVCTFSRITQRLDLDGRDLGLRLEGDLGERVAYLATVTTGQGLNAADVNDAKSVSGRLEVSPVEGLVVSGFAALHDRLDEDVTERHPAYGADLEWGTFREGLHLLGGVVTGENWRATDFPEFLTAQFFGSYYAEIGEPWLAGIEPLFRLSWADPNRDEEDDTGMLLTPGVMFYVEGRNGLSLNLDHYTPDGEEVDPAWSFKVQAFLYF